MKYSGAIRIIVGTLAVGALMFGALLFFLVHGVPLHDFRLWRLKHNFKVVAFYHPLESLLLQKREYLGGPYDHGGLQCGYFVGELRAAPLPPESILRIYDGRFIPSFNGFRRIPLKVLFFSDKPWTMNSPLGDWWDEWRQSSLLVTSSTVYFVYASQEGYPFWGDIRCDD